jgi:hypothetical protein
MVKTNVLVTLMLVAWMLLVTVVFALVTIPPEGRLYTVLPLSIWRLRELIHPLFYSPSIF